jgi:hypothetical protein
VRFSANLPIGWFADVFGATTGYLVLRYLVLVATGWVVYACVLRFADRTVACAAVALLMCGTFFLRLVLWDYTSFVALPASIMAAAVWQLGATPRQRWASAAAAGFLICAAVFANPLAAFILPALYGVEALAALRGGLRMSGHFIVRCLCSAGGAALCFALGYLGYATQLGWFPPSDLVTPTLDFIRANDQLAAPFQIPARQWLEHEPRVYAPVLAAIALVVVMGRRLLATDARARVAQFALAYLAITWLYRKFVTSSGIETWWAYSMTAVTIAFALPAILATLRERAARGVAVAALAATVLADLLLRSNHDAALSIYTAVRSHLWLLAVALLVSLAAIVALRVRRAAPVAMGLVAASVAFFALSPANFAGIGETGEFSRFGSGGELDGYAAARSMTKLLARYDQPDARTLMWTNQAGIADIAWTGMPHQQGGIENPEAPAPLSELTPDELAAIRYPTTRRLLVFDANADVVAGARALLARNGVRTVLREHGTWGDGRVAYALLELVKP